MNHAALCGFNRAAPKLLPGGFRFAHLATFSKHIRTFGTDASRLQACRSEHANALFGDERATVQTVRHGGAR